MTRTEERLADALDAAARAMPEDDMRPLIVPVRRSRRLAWAAPVASAAALLLVVGIAVIVAGHLPGSGRATNAVPAPHLYYVAADRSGDLPQVWSTVTGQPTATLQVPHVRNPQEPALVAAAGDVFFAAVAQQAGEALYRFRLTATGQITDLSPLPGGVLAGTDWDVHAMAASPDGRWLALALTFPLTSQNIGSICLPNSITSNPSNPSNAPITSNTSSNSGCISAWSGPDALFNPGLSDNVAIVNTVSGARSAWQGAQPATGLTTTFSVPSLSWSANSQSVNFIVQGCPFLATSVAEACTSAAKSDRSAAIYQISRPSRPGGPVSGHRVRILDAFYSYLPQALVSPDGSTITAVLTPQLIDAGANGPYVPVVEQISVATQKPVHSLYAARNLGSVPVTVNDVPYAALSTDATGQHWLFSLGYCNAGACGGLNGWIDHGKLVALSPGDGSVADEAW
jgi:hypothetical protein